MWLNSCTSMTGGYSQKINVYVQIQIRVNEPSPIFLLQLYTFEGCDPECLKCSPELGNTDLRRSFHWGDFLELQKIESYWRCYLHMTAFNLSFWILLMKLKINSFTGIFFWDLGCRLVQPAVRILPHFCSFGRCQVTWTAQWSLFILHCIQIPGFCL